MPKAIADLRSLARAHTEMSLKCLAGIAQSGTSETARVAASIALLDRGWGKPAQPVTGADGESGLEITLRQIMEGKT